MNDDVETMIQNRTVPPHSPDLAMRIMAAARAQSPSLFREMMMMFVMPKPAYALAASLILGLVFGTIIDFGTTASSVDTLSQADVLFYLDEGL